MGGHATVRTDRSRRTLLVTFAAVLVVSVAALVVVGASGTATGLELGGGSVAAQEIDADRVTLRATVTESGDAAWRIEYRTRLDTDEREAAFENLSSDVAANESAYADRFRSRMQLSADAAAAATGRSMAVQNVTVEAERRELPEAYGVLVYEFEWTNFAAVSDERMAAGDALAGLFLDEGQRLTLAWPESYELETVRPSPDETSSTSVTWAGPVDFAADEPHVEAVPAGVLGTGIGPLPLALAVIAVLAVAVLLVAYRRRTDGDGSSTPTAGANPDAGEESVEPEEEAASTSGVGAASKADAASKTDTASDAGAEGSQAGTGSDPEELLSNEERVLRLLRENGGRMKQQDVVQTLGWTDARTSQIVSGLREEEKLESFRLGRENVLRLPEADAADSVDDRSDDGGSDEDESGDPDAATGSGPDS